MKKKNLGSVLLLLLGVLALLGAIARGSIYVESNECTGCGDCELVCPVDAITIVAGHSQIDTDKCIRCEICIRACTYNAIRKDK